MIILKYMKNKIKLLILDVDGILTDGRKYYGIDGMPFAKIFCDKDFTAIKRFRALGINVIFLTGDAKVNEKIGINRNIPVYLSRGLDKVDFIDQFQSVYNCNTDEMCFVGDDLFDINIMKAVKYSFCTADSPYIVRSCATVLPVKGGENVIATLFDYCEDHNIIETVDFNTVMNKINELDKNEKF